ncbi:MAG: Stk1 family PASTA domain-containing Ser/Thr kinase, partial [Actinomycetota bacterium]|nr:Stk1 family PASTA domain-containing Ser/Thr kinase [Actinomycetota bacterium]
MAMQQATLGNRYRLLDKLGGGGMAKVYLAHDEILGRDVAVKVLREQFTDDEEFVERFRREARSAASLRHPSIVQIYDQGEADDGSHYMAMEYVSGGTLKERILARGRLSSDEAASVALKVAKALGAAHEKGVIHRDIKPQNVLLTEAGEPKVADFGIALAASAATISQTSRVLGTAGYMSPEQALGERACPRSDLYSLGVVLFEMLVGELPYEADTPVAVAVKHINEPPPPPGDVNGNVPASLGAITLKLLAKRPEDRYPDAAALADDLRRVLDGKAPTGAHHVYVPSADYSAADDAPTTISSAGKAKRKKRGGSMRAAVAVVAGLLLIGGVIFAAVEAPWEETGETAIAESEAPSEGEAPPEVPDVVGLSESEARERLTGEGFEVRASEEESSESDEGNVLRQSAAAGSEAEEGSTVAITVGEGPASAETPNLIYESEAAAQLEEANLELGDVSYSPNDADAGVITSQNPTAGTEVEEGAAVDITVSTGPEEIVEPAPAEPAPAEP